MSLYLVIDTRVRVEIRMNEKCSHVITDRGADMSDFQQSLFRLAKSL